MVDVTFSSYDKYPSVAKSNGGGFALDSEWSVSWQRQYSTNDRDIRGAQIHHDGALVHPSFSRDFSGANDFHPEASSLLDATYGPRDYLVTYQRLDGADWEIYASAMRGSTRITRANLSHLWQSDLCAVAWQDTSASNTYGDIEGGVYALPAHFGQVGVNDCINNPNSTGTFGLLTVTGSGVASRNDLVLEARQLPGNSTLFFLTSQAYGSVANPGGSSGILCLTGQIGRFAAPGQVQNTGGAGVATLRLNLQQQPTPSGLVSVNAGQTWYFQAWHRDALPGGATTSNFTTASTVTFF